MQPSFPLLTDRIQSTFIDALFLVIMMLVITSIIERYENVPDWVRMFSFITLFVLYEPIATTLGFTVGNYVKGLRVKKIGDTTKRINILQAFVRFVLKFSLGWISFLTIHSNPNRQAIHDMAAGSVMIKN